MEHSLGDKAEAALCRLLGRPEKSLSDDRPLPPCDIQVSSCVECEELALNSIKKRIRRPKTLTSLKPGQIGVLAFIRGGRQGVKRLSDLGLTVGAQVTLLNSAPFGGPIEISVRGSKLAIGRGLANKVFVETNDDL
jgi:DtxR family Mn-dependent transcriptional regulator